MINGTARTEPWLAHWTIPRWCQRALAVQSRGPVFVPCLTFSIPEIRAVSRRSVWLFRITIILDLCVLCSFCLLYTVENWSSLDDDPICICQLDNFKATDEAPSGHWARDAVVVVDVSLQRPLHLATPPSSSSWTSLRRLIWSFDAREECARARYQRLLFTCLGLGQIIPLVRRMVLSPGF